MIRCEKMRTTADSATAVDIVDHHFPKLTKPQAVRGTFVCRFSCPNARSVVGFGGFDAQLTGWYDGVRRVADGAHARINLWICIRPAKKDQREVLLGAASDSRPSIQVGGRVYRDALVSVVKLTAADNVLMTSVLSVLVPRRRDR